MLQVARGLKYLHSRRVAHRDLKSLNVLVKPLTGAPELKAELAQNLQRTQIHQRSSPQRLNTPFLENLSCCQVANQVMQNMLT
jgi:serine/threonine protein kinase